MGVRVDVCGGGVSVDPGDGDPLGSGGHQVHGLFQQADGVVDLVVDDRLVEVVGVGGLEHLRLLLEPLKGVVLGGAGQKKLIKKTERLTRRPLLTRTPGLLGELNSWGFVLTGSFLHHFGILDANCFKKKACQRKYKDA